MKRGRHKQPVFEPRRVEVIERRTSPEPVRRFVPPPCQSCAALRPELLAQGKIDQATADNPSSVYTTREKVRYCRCQVCGATWKVAVS